MTSSNCVGRELIKPRGLTWHPDGSSAEGTGGALPAEQKTGRLGGVLTSPCLLRNEQMRLLPLWLLRAHKERDWIIYVKPHDRLLRGPATAAHACDSDSGALSALSHLGRELVPRRGRAQRRDPEGKPALRVLGACERRKAALPSAAAPV